MLFILLVYSLANYGPTCLHDIFLTYKEGAYKQGHSSLYYLVR